MKQTRRHLSAALLVLLGGVPLSIAATLLLWPFWKWLESTSGIEAVGHSGPAEWCYLATFALGVAAGTGVYAIRLARRS